MKSARPLPRRPTRGRRTEHDRSHGTVSLLTLLVVAMPALVGAPASARSHAYAPSAAASAATNADLPDAARARLAFERLKSLVGTWKTASTKGWQGVDVYKLVGKGSTLISSSELGTKGESDYSPMLTAYYLDGDRLMLTHFCEAGNQPRMVAREISADGKHIVFTFLDSTNLPSLDTGHMHSAEIDLRSENPKSRWSFFRNGQESFGEVIEQVRVDP
jgi:hypothetical protein